ncbi:MAG: hypothetical protein LBU67_10700 [Oscillospiraceae bacterium]|jgi:hypothetical protein|nr:hypothetical protein [Oscillospiraceae bacterium]
MLHTLLRARALLNFPTPLLADCGRLCGAACCAPQANGTVSGMLLYPGEAELYADVAWARMLPTDWRVGGEATPLLVCAGRCPRADRPLACRLFPLAPRMGDGPPVARLDPQAGAVCPLAPSGVGGLAPGFVRAAQDAFALLWTHPAHRDFLIALAGELDALEALNPFAR